MCLCGKITLLDAGAGGPNGLSPQRMGPYFGDREVRSYWSQRLQAWAAVRGLSMQVSEVTPQGWGKHRWLAQK